MPRIKYDDWSPEPASLATVANARAIIREYAEEGYTLTLRQLYYQFVARDLVANDQREYDRLGRIVSRARLAGLLDWEAIEDRTRNVVRAQHWDSPGAIARAAANTYRVDRWARQPRRVEVWIEKDALVGVLDGVCNRLDVPLLSCRGYTSQSEMWSGAMRLRDHALEGQDVVVLHLGDHDPSGIDMTRDVRDRLGMFMTGKADTHCSNLEVRRIALTWDQVEEHDPPPNPAKVTDSRFESYRELYGHESWELDALEPSVLAGLVEDHVNEIRDDALWEAALAREREGREAILEAARDLPGMDDGEGP